LLHDGFEAGLFIRRQCDAGQLEISQRVFQQLDLRSRQTAPLAIQHPLIRRIQFLVLTQLGVPSGQERQARCIRGSQLIVVHDAVQMADG
jgi:hypothetical protein